MADDKTQPPAEPRTVQPKSHTAVFLDMHENEANRDAARDAAERAERKERDATAAKDRADERAANQRTIRAWQLTAALLILVLLVLVAGLVGVGVTGHIPGVGDIGISQPKESP